MARSIRFALSIPGGIRGVQLAVTVAVASFDDSFGLLLGFELVAVGCLVLTSGAILQRSCRAFLKNEFRNSNDLSSTCKKVGIKFESLYVFWPTKPSTRMPSKDGLVKAGPPVSNPSKPQKEEDETALQFAAASKCIGPL
jgi:hypothetical protein